MSDHCTEKIVAKLEAVQEATSLIGEFSQRFAAAARAPDETIGIKTAEILPLLTKKFEIVVQDGEIRDVATDYETLLQLIIRIRGKTYYSSLVGSLTVTHYKRHEAECNTCCHNGRVLEMKGVDYAFQANPDSQQPPTIFTGLIALADTFLVVETKKCRFKLHNVLLNAEFRGEFQDRLFAVAGESKIFLKK